METAQYLRVGKENTSKLNVAAGLSDLSKAVLYNSIHGWSDLGL